MRIAILSDIHGNRTAFDAVVEDIRDVAPDLVLHGGDLADGGSSPVHIIDSIRDLGWSGVVGNTDEMLFAPETLEGFAAGLPSLRPLFDAVTEMAAWSREQLGSERIHWLRGLPESYVRESFALVHASPDDRWRAPSPEAADDILQSKYTPLARPLVVYGHIHRPYVRRVDSLTIANSGSVGLPYDGDPRASYLLLDGTSPTIRRVEYDVEREIRALSNSGIPHHDWVARTLRTATVQHF